MKLFSIMGRGLFQLATISIAFSFCAQENLAAPTKQAAKAAPPKAATSAPGNPIYNNYVNQLRPKIDKNWNFPTGKNHVVLSVDVAPDGSVSNLVLTSNPKSGEAEQKASDAFNSAQPLPSLPSGSSAKLEVTFDSQADQWDSKSSIGVRMDPVKGSSSTAPPADEKSESSAPAPPPASN
ncbi:MAG: TonB C-terminal domain-containing protein [Candidatus Obscuribacterales bacterium]|jgi:hypothetical protein|nr:TonB C-terminal domain-containing protein [Candidatus Obscuribacterales bacterium]